MRDDLAQPHRQHRQRFVQAERIAQVLRDLEQRLHFLARRGDGGEEVDRCASLCPRSGRDVRGRFEARRRRIARARSLTSVESFPVCRVPCLRLLLQLDVAPASAPPPLADRSLARFRRSRSSWPRPAAAPGGTGGRVASASRQSTAARMRAPIGNFFAREPVRIAACRPIFRDARARSAPPDRGTAPVPESRRPPPDGSSSSRTLPASACRAWR